MCWEPFDGVGDAFQSRACTPHSVTLVVVECWAEVEPIDGMWGPGVPAGRFLMEQDMGAWRGQWSPVVVKHSMHLGVRGEAWIDSGASE